MSLEELFSGHYEQLVRAFGVANAEDAYKGDKLLRAFGDQA